MSTVRIASCTLAGVVSVGFPLWSGSPALLVERKQSESCDPVGSKRSFGQPCLLLPVRDRGGAKNRQRRGTPRRCCTPLALSSTKSAGEPTHRNRFAGQVCHERRARSLSDQGCGAHVRPGEADALA